MTSKSFVAVATALAVLSATSISLSYGWSAYHDPNCKDNRVAMVHLFEWKWNDIAAECERFLAPMGYCGVQVSPPNEHVIVDGYPWWQRYQPVSYKLESRSGNRQEFINMVERCNNVGIRIYVDAIINHMSGTGRSGKGSGGSDFDADEMHFPAVPYTIADFNGCGGCPACCCINSWTDVAQVRNCRLLGLTDLNQALPGVRQKIAGFLNDLIDIGVAGFRIDAGKHMWPADLKAISELTNDLNTKWFPAGRKAFFFYEVIDLAQVGEVRAQEYTGIGKVTEFRYCIKINDVAGGLWGIHGLYDPGWGMVESTDAFVFVDNHDNQRGHGGGGNVVTYKNPRKYKVAQAVTLGYTYGHPRVMSSYEFTTDGQGPPANGDGSTKDVVINADGSCGNGWVCEHRWQAIAGMASFRKAVANANTIDNQRTEGNKVAFSRGGRGFVAISNEGSWSGTFQTGMPAGRYCNVIRGCPNSNGGCNGAEPVTVNSDGTASVSIADWDNPIFAIHVEAKAGSGSCTGSGGGVEPPPETTTTPGPTQPPRTNSPDREWRRTVVLVRKATAPGQNLFLRGGVDHERCNGNADPDRDPCSVGIRINSLGSGQHYNPYTDWSRGSTKLNWHGAQSAQGSHNGQRAAGVPLVWTTNQQGHPGYQALNSYGDHYWMVDMDVDCGATDNGWFEFKGYVLNGEGWEGNVQQTAQCSGSLGGRPPFSSSNHAARCGAVNVFQFGSGECTIDSL
ncbi:hypothetical protein BOX15_Mlig014993g1 [Macrostomum lignano]|nr:hypothetical protein BOX15_Mlig014993g2 [Macrostomum lignano]PAA57542.1 hypothetical protein BOX15_Mlig014993g1 [Macrostomum lignano]